MNISPNQATLLANIREWAQDPLALFYSVGGKHSTVAIFPDAVIGKTDEQLLAFIVKRLSESAPRRALPADNRGV